MPIAVCSYSQNLSGNTLPQKIVFNGVPVIVIDTNQSDLICEMWGDIKAYRLDKKYGDSIISEQQKTIHDLTAGNQLRDSLCASWEKRYNSKRNQLTTAQNKNKWLVRGLFLSVCVIVVEVLILK